MILLEKTFTPSSSPVWVEEVEASQLLIKSWPDRGRPLQIEYMNTRGEYSSSIRNPEPGQRIRLAPRSQGELFSTPSRVRLSVAQPAEEILSQAHCQIWALTDPEDLHEVRNLEAQGDSLTKGTTVTIRSGALDPVGQFTAWKTGYLRVCGQASVNPVSLRFRLRGYWDSSTGKEYTGDTGAIAHTALEFEYPIVKTSAGYAAIVHAGRLYQVELLTGAGVNVGIDADIYIEPLKQV